MSECYNFNTFAAVSVVNQIFQIKLVITQTMKNYVKALLLTTVLFGVNIVGGVKAENPLGTYPACITNLKYDDYSLFVNSKHVKITWTVTDATAAANSYLLYYVADENEPSWYKQRVYWYTKNYEFEENQNGSMNTYQRRIVHLDQGPTAKAGNQYTTFYNSDSELSSLSTDPAVSDMGIGWVPSMNPFLVGRSVKWDDPTSWDDDPSKPVVQRVALSAGELDLGEISKSKIVFFTFKDAAGNYYAGPDKLTNSQAAADRHSTMSLLPWNECYISAHLNVPMPLKILWSSEEGGTPTEVPAGTDVVFPSTAWVKFEWNADFISAVQSYDSNFLSNYESDYEIYYTTTSLIPVRNADRSNIAAGDTYTTDRLAAIKYEGTPIEISANTVLRFAIFPKNSTTMYLGQDDHGGNINDVLTTPDQADNTLNNEGNQLMKKYEESRYSNNSDADYYNSVGIYGDYDNAVAKLGTIPPIQTFLRNNYLWGITFIKEASVSKRVAKTFSRPIPYMSWSENIGGRYGLGAGTYSYETWVSDGDYLVPSSLEGICDFFIVSQTNWSGGEYEINPFSSAEAKTKIYLSRINWIPKGMPVIVRYRNYSTPNPLPASVQTAINSNNAAAEAELENGLYFHGNCNDDDYSPAHYDSNVLKAVFSGDYDTNSSTGISESVPYTPDGSDPRTWQYSLYNNNDGSVYENENGSGKKWATPLTDTQGHRQYVYMTYENGDYYQMYKAYENYNGTETPLYYVWDTTNDCPALQKTADGYTPLFYKTDYQGNALYQALDNDNNPLYQVYDDNVSNLVYYAVDSNNDKQWQEVDGSGNRLYYYHYHNVSGADYREYQQVDSNGNPLYCVMLGPNMEGYYVTFEYDGESHSAGPMSLSVANSQVATWENDSHYSNISVVQATTTTDNGYPLYGETVTDYPHTSIYGESNDPVITAVNTGYYAYTTDKNAYPVTTTTENDYPLGTTTVTAKRLTTTYYSNDEYANETGYVLTRNEPVIDTDNTYDGSSNKTNCAYTITDNGHPVTTTSSSSSYGWYTPYTVNASISFVISPYITTDASHVDANAPEGVAYHVPLYIDPEQDNEHGTYEKKLYDFGGNAFTNIRTLSNTVLTGSSSANYDFTAEPHTFYLYPGDPEHCQYDKEWYRYHLSTRLHRDEANFLNVLQYSETPITVTSSNNNYYGFSIDHKNEFHPALGAAWATEYNSNSLYSSKDYAFGAGADYEVGPLNVSLHTASFMDRYYNLCYNSTTSYYTQPVVDNWLVYAPSKGDATTDIYDRTNCFVMPYYYGLGPTDQMRKQSTLGSDEDYNTPYDSGSDSYKEQQDIYGNAFFGGWTSAAWKHVTSGTIAARRPYLQMFSNYSFVDPSKIPTRPEDDNIDYTQPTTPARLTFTAGGGLSLLDEFYAENSGTVTALRSAGTSSVQADNAVYDLQGRRVADNLSSLPDNLAKGVYIVNGKKHVVK